MSKKSNVEILFTIVDHASIAGKKIAAALGELKNKVKTLPPPLKKTSDSIKKTGDSAKGADSNIAKLNARIAALEKKLVTLKAKAKAAASG